MKLPYGEATRLEQIAWKVETYSLNTEHSEGKHKAILFRAKLGITIENKEVLITALLDTAINGKAVFTRTTQYGESYLIDFSLTTETDTSVIRSAWLINFEKQYPHLVSVYPIRTKETPHE